MRAPSPNDSLEPASSIKAYPKCAYTMHQKIHITEQGYINWVARLRKDHERISRRLRRQGYGSGVSFKKMYIFLNDNKHDVTSPLYVAGQERVGEIVGMHCRHGQPLIMVGNECDLNSGSCHSGVSYMFDVLLRKTDEHGRKICYIATKFSYYDLEAI
jgi:hypothetical protein